MDSLRVGQLIRALRQGRELTQRQLADELSISVQAVSKWERGLGMPDVSLLPMLAEQLNVSIERLLSGELNESCSIGGNMKNIKFYVCPVCSNLIWSTSEASVACCGHPLESLTAVKPDDEHTLVLEPVEDELFVTIAHEATKQHYISFVAVATGDNVTVYKQYPEWELNVRFRKRGHGILYYYCTNHGLFKKTF